MSLLKQIECTDEEISAFWTWFAANETKLSDKDGIQRAHTLKAAQVKLLALFPGCQQSVHFCVIPCGDRWEISVSFGTKQAAKRIAKRMRVLMPANLQGKWHMEIIE